MAWKPRVQDGMLMGAPDGGRYRVFNPPAWRLDRWLGWYAGRARAAVQLAAMRLGAPVKLPQLFAAGRIPLTFHDAKGKPVVVQLRVERVQISKYNVVASAIRKL